MQPERPPILPPTINEEVFAPKRQMNVVKESAAKRLKKYNKKFEKRVRKFLKKAGEKERYLQFYDIGYRFEAVFCEITSDGMTFSGEALAPEKGWELIESIIKDLRLPFHEGPAEEPSEIHIACEKDATGALHVLQLVAGEEFKEIKRLATKVENAPRFNNPGA